MKSGGWTAKVRFRNRSSKTVSKRLFEFLEPRNLLAASPVISEFMASNGTSLLDEDGDASDWIEVYNPDAESIDLNGWHLTDSDSDLTKWTLPPARLGAGEYLVIFASDKNRAVAGQELHTNFKLSAGGESLALVQPDGTTVVSAYSPEYPAQQTDVSYGQSLDGRERGYFLTPTPGVPEPLRPGRRPGPPIGD